MCTYTNSTLRDNRIQLEMTGLDSSIVSVSILRIQTLLNQIKQAFTASKSEESLLENGTWDTSHLNQEQLLQLPQVLLEEFERLRHILSNSELNLGNPISKFPDFKHKLGNTPSWSKWAHDALLIEQIDFLYFIDRLDTSSAYYDVLHSSYFVVTDEPDITKKQGTLKLPLKLYRNLDAVCYLSTELSLTPIESANNTDTISGYYRIDPKGSFMLDNDCMIHKKIVLICALWILHRVMVFSGEKKSQAIYIPIIELNRWIQEWVGAEQGIYSKKLFKSPCGICGSFLGDSLPVLYIDENRPLCHTECFLSIGAG
jgi:hypothetical protein